MTETLRVSFDVQGSAPVPYRVTFESSGPGSLAGVCSCPAGENGQACKHRLEILAGRAEGIVSGNEHQVPLVSRWLSGSNIEQALRGLATAEEQLAVAKRAVAQAKRTLGAAMRGTE